MLAFSAPSPTSTGADSAKRTLSRSIASSPLSLAFFFLPPALLRQQPGDFLWRLTRGPLDLLSVHIQKLSKLLVVQFVYGSEPPVSAHHTLQIQLPYPRSTPRPSYLFFHKTREPDRVHFACVEHPISAQHISNFREARMECRPRPCTTRPAWYDVRHHHLWRTISTAGTASRNAPMPPRKPHASTFGKVRFGGSGSARTSDMRLTARAANSPGPSSFSKSTIKYSFRALPLTTAPKPNPYRLPIGTVDGRQAFATLSQLRNIDSKRLVKKIAHLDADILTVIKKEASNFG